MRERSESDDKRAFCEYWCEKNAPLATLSDEKQKTTKTHFSLFQKTYLLN